MIDHLGISKVRQLDLIMGVDEDVSTLDVSMNYLVGVEVEQSSANLAGEVRGQFVGKRTTFFNEVQEGASVHVLEVEVQIALPNGVPVKLNHILALNVAQDLDLVMEELAEFL